MSNLLFLICKKEQDETVKHRKFSDQFWSFHGLKKVINVEDSLRPYHGAKFGRLGLPREKGRRSRITASCFFKIIIFIWI